VSLIPQLSPTFEAALRDARSKSVRHRRAAATRLAAPEPAFHDQAFDALLVLADDLDPMVRDLALEGLGHLADARALDLVIGRLEDGAARVRETAVVALGRIGGKRAAKAVEKALSNKYAEVRFQAVASYAEIAPEAAPDKIAALLRDEDAEVRANAATTLGLLRASSHASAVAKLLEDPKKNVRAEAALALAEMGDTRGVFQLVEALSDPERAIAAALAIGDLRAVEAKEKVAQIASKRFFVSVHFKAAAAAALAAMGDERGIPTLRSILVARRSDARGFAAELVARYGLVALSPELAELVERPRVGDPLPILEAAVELSPKAPALRTALEGIARGDSEVAKVVRTLLERPA
jgi:HEAT repeat protein